MGGMPPSKPNSTLSVLKDVAIFSGLSEAEFASLAERTAPKKFGEGELIFGEGEPCLGLYVIESGHARIFKSSAGGREQVLSIDGPGSSIAEIPVFDGGSYPASAQAITTPTLLFISKQDFPALCLQHPEVPLKVLRVVGSRLRPLVGIIEELSFTTVRHRLAALLVLREVGGHEGEQWRRLYPASEQQRTGGANRHGARARVAQPEPAGVRGPHRN